MKRLLRLLVVALGLGFAAVLWMAFDDGSILSPDASADRVLIDKSERQMTLLRGGRPLKSYRISLGRNPIGHKRQEGDGRTPEGFYRVDFHKRDSAFHRALHISYPSPEDIASATRAGVSPGGDIMIHGLPNGMGVIGKLHRRRDWTEGCIAVTNNEIEEIWRAVPDGTPVEITP
jgi:murein L,D-transpeptidase YafK